jgi:MFS family permease
MSLSRHDEAAGEGQPPRRFAAGMRRTFQSLDVPAYRILWWGTLFSFIGMQMQMVARGYLAFDLTGNNTALGGVMIAFGVPQLVLALHGGAVADRMSKRNVLIVWQSVIALASGLMAIAIATGNVQYWMLIATGVATGASFAFIGPARQAFIGDLVPPTLMGNAIVLQQANMNGTRVVGPALAGALIAIPLIGMAGVYAVTTVGFIIAVVTMFKLPPGMPKRRTDQRSATQETIDGFRYVGHHRSVAILLLTSFVVVAFAFPYQGFLASITKDEFDQGAVGLGVLSSVAAVGALVATLVVANLTNHRNAWRIQSISGIAFGAALIGFGLAPSFGAALVLILAVGAGASAFQSLNNALTMMVTDPQYYGRVQALMGLSWSLFGIISLPLGFLADAIGIRATFALMGAAAIVAVVMLEVLGSLIGAEADMRSRRASARRDPFTRTPTPAEESAQPVEAAR